MATRILQIINHVCVCVSLFSTVNHFFCSKFVMSLSFLLCLWVRRLVNVYFRTTVINKKNRRWWHQIKETVNIVNLNKLFSVLLYFLRIPVKLFFHGDIFPKLIESLGKIFNRKRIISWISRHPCFSHEWFYQQLMGMSSQTNDLGYNLRQMDVLFLSCKYTWLVACDWRIQEYIRSAHSEIVVGKNAFPFACSMRLIYDRDYFLSINHNINQKNHVNGHKKIFWNSVFRKLFSSFNEQQTHVYLHNETRLC